MAHSYYDLENKGVSANYCTNTFEKRHGLSKDIYDQDTNKKDIARQASSLCTPCKIGLTTIQILKIEHRFFIALNMRENIEVWQERNKPPSEDETEQCDYQFGSIYMGSRRTASTLHALEFSKLGDSAFIDFTSWLSTFVNKTLLPPGSALVDYRPSDMVRVSSIEGFSF